MTTEQLFLLKLIKNSIWNTCDVSYITKDVNVDLQKVIKESTQARMCTVAFEGLNKLIVNNVYVPRDNDKENLAYWRKLSVLEIINNKNILKIQESTVKMLEENDIPYCIIKGSSVAQYYPNSAQRRMGDIDIYVGPVRFKEACDLFINNSYEEEGTYSEYHTAYKKNGVEIEVHNAFSGLPVGKTRNSVYQLVDSCNRGINSKMNEISFYEPVKEDNILILLIHMIHHAVEDGLTLRQMCDWMLFINNNIDDDAWNGGISELLQKANLDHAAKIFTKFCNCYMGLDNQNITWYKDVMQTDVNNLLEFLFKEPVIKGIGKKREGLPRNLWDYQRQVDVNYEARIVGRTLGKLLSGEKSIKQVYARYRNVKDIRKKLVKLNLFTYKDSKDYAMQ